MAPAKTLTVCHDTQDPATLDPQKEFSEKNHLILQQIYEPLVRLDAAGKLQPALAESWSRRDPLRMRFTLRAGVVFHDGEPLDAEAVRFTIARYLDPKTGFPARGFLGSIEKAEVVDPLTVDIVTKFPDGILLNRLASFVLIVPPKYVTEQGEGALDRLPVGTGAFKFVSWERGRSITLARNERYWDAGRPKADRLVFRFLPTERQLPALVSGEVDLVTELSGTQTAEAVRSGAASVVKTPTFYALYGSFNSARKPMSDARVRRAINLAVDREALVRYDVLGNGRVNPSVTMEGEEGHAAGLKPYPHDLAQAKRLLREAGYPNGFSIKMAANVQGERTARIVAKQLAEAGVTVEVSSFTAEQIAAMDKTPFDMTIGGCPDPMAHTFFIQSILLYSKSPFSFARNEDYDKRLEAAVSLLDDGARRRAFEDLDRYLYDEALLVPLYQRIKTYGLRRGVSFTPPVTGMPYFLDADKAEVAAKP